MGLAALHRVHWVLIALVLGVAFGLVFDTSHAELYGVNVHGYGLLLPNQQEFENGLVQEYEHIRLFSDPVVYPHWGVGPDGDKQREYVVAGRYWNGNAHMKDGKAVAEWVPRCVITKTPYKPQTQVVERNGQATAEFPSVLEFLDAMHRVYGVKYQYAWWAAYPMLTWLTASLLVVGGIWPTVVNLLAFGSFTRPAEAPTLSFWTLWKVRSRPAVEKKPVLKSFAAPHDPNLDALVAASLAHAEDEADESEPVAALSTEPVQAVPQAPKDPKAFGAKRDDFYPTELRKPGSHP